MVLPLEAKHGGNLEVSPFQGMVLKLPNTDRALVPPEKVLRYLLSIHHPRGGPKARFFRALGFTPARGPVLVAGLLEIAERGEVTETVGTAFGTKYVVVGEICAPTGEEVRLVTVWIILEGEEGPRFVTAYPAHNREHSHDP